MHASLIRRRNCPVCRVSMVRVDTTPDGHELYSCPLCGGALLFGPTIAGGETTVSMSSRLASRKRLAITSEPPPQQVTVRRAAELSPLRH